MESSGGEPLASVPVLMITGPVGVGKTTVALEASAVLREAKIAHALVDLAQIGHAWPTPADDRWNERLIHRNLGAMWANFKEAGVGRLVLCRVLEERSLLRHVVQAVPGCDITVVRLRAPLQVLHDRIRAREGPRSPEWFLNAATYLVKRLDETQVEDILVETEGRSPSDIAAEVLKRAGWLL